MSTYVNLKKQEAFNAYKEAILEALDVADNIGDIIRDCMPVPDEDVMENYAITWATVGSAREIRTRLLGLQAFVRGEEE